VVSIMPESASAEGVGALLAGDRSGVASVPSSPQTKRRRITCCAERAGFAAGARQIVGKPDSYGLRPESKTSSTTLIA